MPDLADQFAQNGFVVFDADPRVTRWATRAQVAARVVSRDVDMQSKWLRHAKTWFVGVDALPNGADGAVDGVALDGPWGDLVAPPEHWHSAQVSIVYPGYPVQDPTDSDAAHRFRVRRCAAHVDGLHLENARRIVREPHAFILGLPLNDSTASPLVVWPGSQVAMKAALRAAIGDGPVIGADVTQAYVEARAQVFESIAPVKIEMSVGQSVLLDRFMLHGVAPWTPKDITPPDGRMVAYFRPECAAAEDWLR